MTKCLAAFRPIPVCGSGPDGLRLCEAALGGASRVVSGAVLGRSAIDVAEPTPTIEDRIVALWKRQA